MATNLEKTIKAVGLAKLARKVGVRPQVLHHWRTRGVPAAMVLKLESATDGKLSRHDLRPDLYPPEAA